MKARKFICYILVPIAFLLGVLSMPSSSNVNYLPALDFNNPYELRNSVEDILLNKINATREKYGLLPVAISSVLNKTSKYKSLYISQYPDNLSTSVFISGPLKDKSNSNIYPYVKNEEVIFLSDSRYTQESVLAEYLAKTLENGYKAGRILLDPNIKIIGISIVYFNLKTVCVIHSSDNNSLLDDINVIPDIIVKNDTTPPAISSSDIFIAKDFALDTKKVNSAIKYVDNSSQECSISYDIKQVDTTKIGVYDLNVTVSDKAGNKASNALKVNVVPHIYPVITDEELILPNVNFDDIYDLSKYINIQDNYGVESINAEPKFALKGDDGKSVKVSVLNKAGLKTEKTLKIKFSDIPFYASPTVKVNSIYPNANEPLTIDMIKSAIICFEEGAIIDVDTDSFNNINREVNGVYYCNANVKVYRDESYIQTSVAVPVHINTNTSKASFMSTVQLASSKVNLTYSKMNKSGLVEVNSNIILNTVTTHTGDINYVFSFKKYGENSYSISRKSSSVIWYPETEGLYEVKVMVVDNKNSILETSAMNLFVSEKTLSETHTPYLELKPDSVYVMDSVKKLVSNISDKLKVSDFVSGFVVSDEGINGLQLRVKNIQGNLLTDNAFVGTGCLLELYKGDTIYEKYEILLYGDINGDGAIDLSDYAYIRQNILGNVEIKEIKLVAANIAERNKVEVNLSDYAMLRQHLLGNYEIKQK